MGKAFAAEYEDCSSDPVPTSRQGGRDSCNLSTQETDVEMGSPEQAGYPSTLAKMAGSGFSKRHYLSIYNAGNK